MAIPDYESVMRPLLEHLAGGKEKQADVTLDDLARYFGLTAAERQQLLPSGKQALFTNRVGWAKTYLKKAGAVASPRRGMYVITDRGRELLREHPGSIDSSVLQRYPEFREFLLRSASSSDRKTTTERVDVARTGKRQPEGAVRSAVTRELSPDELSPEELLEQGYSQLNGQLAVELLEQLGETSADCFEKLVVDVLIALGYGGSRRDAGRRVGRSGDGGIDGVIDEDRLGLDTIYIQAKRWEGTVGRPEVQKFAGALQGQRARKGVFITTSTFSREALDFVRNIDAKIVLIDGDELARLMIEHGVGVSEVATYTVKKVDTDYFTGE